MFLVLIGWVAYVLFRFVRGRLLLAARQSEHLDRIETKIERLLVRGDPDRDEDSARPE